MCFTGTVLDNDPIRVFSGIVGAIIQFSHSEAKLQAIIIRIILDVAIHLLFTRSVCVVLVKIGNINLRSL